VHLDLERSRGVLGYLQEPALGATYVHLDASPEAVLRLSGRPAARPHLRSATHSVENLAWTGMQLDFETRGPGRRRFVFAGLPAGLRYRIAMAAQGPSPPAAQATVDEQGLLDLSLGAAPPGRLHVFAAPIQP
jgi:hypothetical protein